MGDTKVAESRSGGPRYAMEGNLGTLAKKTRDFTPSKVLERGKIGRRVI
jgi:hypothetical protein